MMVDLKIKDPEPISRWKRADQALPSLRVNQPVHHEAGGSHLHVDDVLVFPGGFVRHETGERVLFSQHLALFRLALCRDVSETDQ